MVKPAHLVFTVALLFINAFANILVGAFFAASMSADQTLGLIGFAYIALGLFAIVVAYGLWSMQAWGLRLLVFLGGAHVALAIIMFTHDSFMVSALAFAFKALNYYLGLTVAMAVYFLYVAQNPNISSLYADKIPNIGIKFGNNPPEKTQVSNRGSGSFLLSAIVPEGTVRRGELSANKPIVIAGRGEGVFDLGDTSVSRSHARFEWNAGSPTVRDLGSTNGTIVSGKTVGVDPVPIFTSDSIQLGAVKIKLSKV